MMGRGATAAALAQHRRGHQLGDPAQQLLRLRIMGLGGWAAAGGMNPYPQGQGAKGQPSQMIRAVKELTNLINGRLMGWALALQEGATGGAGMYPGLYGYVTGEGRGGIGTGTVVVIERSAAALPGRH